MTFAIKETQPFSIPASKELLGLALGQVSALGFHSIPTLLQSGRDVSEPLQARAGELIRDFGISAKMAQRVNIVAETSSFHIEKRLLEETPEIQLYCPQSRAYPLQL